MGFDMWLRIYGIMMNDRCNVLGDGLLWRFRAMTSACGVSQHTITGSPVANRISCKYVYNLYVIKIKYDIIWVWCNVKEFME